MGVGGCMSCIKYCLFVFNLLFWLIGCALVGVGIWIVVDAKQFIDTVVAKIPENVQDSLGTGNEETVKILGIVAIVIGGIILILGFLGCCGAIRENQAMLALFFSFLLLIFCVLVAIGVLVFVYGNQVQQWLRNALNKEVEKNVTNGLLKYANEKFDCCGIDNEKLGICTKSYPPYDKCARGMPNCKKGCFESIWNSIDKMKLGLGVALLVSGGIIIFGMIFSMCLCCSIRNSYDYD